MYKKNIVLGVIFLGTLCGGLSRQKLDTISSRELFKILEKANFDETPRGDLILLKRVVLEHLAQPNNKFNPAIRNSLTEILARITMAMPDPLARFQHKWTQTEIDECAICGDALLEPKINNPSAWRDCSHHIFMHKQCIANHFKRSALENCPTCRSVPFSRDTLHGSGRDSTVYYPNHLSFHIGSPEEMELYFEKIYRWRHIQSLDITTALMDLANIQILAELLPSLPNLTSLKINFGKSRTNIESIILLTRNNLLAHLNELSLTNSLMGENEVYQLAQCLPNRLIDLDLSDNAISTEAIALLAPHLRQMRHLENLDLSFNCIGNCGVAALVGNLPPQLMELDLDYNGIESNDTEINGINMLQQLISHLPHLTMISLKNNAINPDELAKIQTPDGCRVIFE